MKNILLVKKSESCIYPTLQKHLMNIVATHSLRSNFIRTVGKILWSSSLECMNNCFDLKKSTYFIFARLMSDDIHEQTHLGVVGGHLASSNRFIYIFFQLRISKSFFFFCYMVEPMSLNMDYSKYEFPRRLDKL